MINLKNKKIILFDGVCNLCNSSVHFIIKKDKKKQFLFTSLQSDAARDILLQFQLKNSELDSILLIENGQVYQKSDAILKIVKHLNGIWKMCYGFIILPKFIRDYVYIIIAKNRYRWFGKREVCMIPTKELEMRFLD
jgi:predicted DCC family thiol-disulfide oxidoreductase YuxK